MKRLLTLAAGAEIATGATLVLTPSLVIRLLLGADLSGLAGRDDLAAVGIVIARVTGIALISLGVACWPGRTALCGMLTYNALGALYFLYLGIRGEWVGPLLWPAVVLHALLTLALWRAWSAARATSAK